MKEQLISIPVAKLAKEKGFDLIADKLWVNYYTGEPLNKWKLIPYEKKTLNWMEWRAPTQSILQKWLREIHNIDVIVDKVDNTSNSGYYFNIYSKNVEDDEGIIEFKTYEEALEKGMYEALKLIVI